MADKSRSQRSRMGGEETCRVRPLQGRDDSVHLSLEAWSKAKASWGQDYGQRPPFWVQHRREMVARSIPRHRTLVQGTQESLVGKTLSGTGLRRRSTIHEWATTGTDSEDSGCSSKIIVTIQRWALVAKAKWVLQEIPEAGQQAEKNTDWYVQVTTSRCGSSGGRPPNGYLPTK